MKCCNCGREYDPNKKYEDIQCVYPSDAKERMSVWKISIDANRKNLKLCKYCVRAMTVAAIMSIYGGSSDIMDYVKRVGMPIEFEE